MNRSTLTRTTLTRTAAAAAATALTLALTACGGTADDDATAQETASSTSTSTPTTTPSSQATTEGSAPAAEPTSQAPETPETPEAPAGPNVEVTVDGDDITPNAAEVDLAVGETLTLSFTSDRAGELHVHSSPEQYVEFGAGTTTRELTVETPGVVEVEEHDSGAVVAVLTVS